MAVTDDQVLWPDGLLENSKHLDAHLDSLTVEQSAEAILMVNTVSSTRWLTRSTLTVLPCFEDPAVGAAGGPIGVQIPEERRDKNIITAWEVAGASDPLSPAPPPWPTCTASSS